MQHLVERAKQGQLSRAELDGIADIIDTQETFDDLADQLMIMQFAGDARYRRAVERCLDLHSHLSEANRALQVLCFNWGLVEEYFDWLLTFLDGLEWDLRHGQQIIRSEAFMLAGWYLPRRPSRELLALVLRVAEDETEQDLNRTDAAAALIATFAPPPHLAPLHLELTDPSIPGVLEQARERLRSEPDPVPRAGRVPVPSQVRIPAYVEPLLPPDVVHSPLVARARERDLTADQVRRLATELQRSPTPDQVRHNLVALLYAGDASQRDAVEPHLDAADPEIRRLSLLVLCAGWRLTRDHLARLARLIEGDDPALRRTAVTIAATFLSTRRSRQLLELLLSIVEDHGRPQAIRDEALAALHLATDGFPGGLQDHLSDQDAAHALDSARVRLASE